MNLAISKNFYDISNIPKEWKEMRLKYILSISEKKSSNFNNEKILSLTKSGIIINDITSNIGQIAESYEKYILVEKYQICMNPMDLLSGWVDVSSFDGIISPAYYTFILNSGFENNFIKYFLQSNYLRKTFFKLGKGVASHDNFGRWVLTPDELQNIVIFFPNIKNQKLISLYLDKKINQINLLIKKIKKKIEILKEQQTLFVNQYVTKGLKPNVEMKDSGVFWIGKIPKHWVVSKLKHISQITLGKMLTPKDKGGMILRKYLRSVNVQEDHLNLNDINEMWFSTSEIEKLSILSGDILVNEGGQVGRPCLIQNDLDEFGFQNSINRIRTDKLDSTYLYYFILCAFKSGYYDSIVNRVSIPHLTKEKLENTWVITPPRSEQTKICEKVLFRLSNFHSLIEKNNIRIKLLSEYRLSLISSVVSGKFRVTEDML